MCWNLEVSLGFAGIHLLAAIYVAWHRPPYSQCFLLFILFYFFMELLQALQWFIGVESYLNQSCSKTNTFLTIIAYIFIWLQPIMFVSFANKNNNRFAWYYSLHTLMIAMINLIVGFYEKATGLEMMKRNEKTNYGIYTCTYQGKDNHLVWKFAVSSFNYQPTHYDYFSIILLTFILHYNRTLQSTIAAGWMITYFVSLWNIGDVNAELTSYWCLISVFADIPIIIYTMIHAKKKNKQNID
ncbi:unnamed protein product [Rotaria sp. Silwood2]|nr:unnamed protein product [Rotaria sp. Silwood2]CAF4692714.1 unnamed protein product [Rotaria sp. Silwood2]